MNNVILRNNFHNTSVTIRCPVFLHIHNEAKIYPSVSQIRRAKRELCGIDGCTCSGDAGTRGPQEYNDRRLIVNVSAIFATNR